MKHEVTTTNNINGTGLQGYLSATYGELIKAFGHPNGEPTLDGKVKHCWAIKVDGLTCTIYDYKENLANGKRSDWHIGGQAKACAQLVTEAFEERN